MPAALLRAAWFMENAAWDVAAAHRSQIESSLQPSVRAIEMAATGDIDRVAAELLQAPEWSGARVVELAGLHRYSPRDVAAGFASALEQPVEVVAVPRDTREARFNAEGYAPSRGAGSDARWFRRRPDRLRGRRKHQVCPQHDPFGGSAPSALTRTVRRPRRRTSRPLN